MQLFGIAVDMRLEYISFVIENPDKYFPDFLYEKSLNDSDPIFKFFAKMASCPFCLLTWLSVLASLVCSSSVIIAPVYILSLFVILQIKKLI